MTQASTESSPAEVWRGEKRIIAFAACSLAVALFMTLTEAQALPKRALSKGREPIVSAQPAEAILVNRDVRSLGSISVGHAHAGFLFNAVRMPRGPKWALSVPDHAWGTEETIANLIHCIGRVHEQFPGSPPLIIGSISARNGGHLPPHKSHRTGRDVDIYLYRLPGTKPWYKPAGPDDLDRPRVWALLRAIITETDVEFVLLDRSVQKLLEDHALSIGEDADWIEDLFHGRGKSWQALIKHIPGHTAHMHVRFVSAVARERGRRAYDRLVEQGHVNPPTRQIEHEVVAGDNLSALAQRYGASIDDIVRLNKLKSTFLQLGQKLLIREQRDIRGAREAVLIPPRRIAPKRVPAAKPENTALRSESAEAIALPSTARKSWQRWPLRAKISEKRVTDPPSEPEQPVSVP